MKEKRGGMETVPPSPTPLGDVPNLFFRHLLYIFAVGCGESTKTSVPQALAKFAGIALGQTRQHSGELAKKVLLAIELETLACDRNLHFLGP